MLSIVISSYKPHHFSAIEKNIAETIGIAYEIVKIDNPNLMGICSAYNRGATVAKFDHLLFVHEDVEFRTEKWGIPLINSLNQKNVGVIGVLGSDYVPNVPFAWWDLHENNFSHYTQYEKNKLIGDFNLAEDKRVWVIDGVFMAVKKTVLDQVKFDERIKGFHGYDVAFSLNIAASYQNMVTSKIKIAHFSYAVKSLNKDWMDHLISSRIFYSVPKTQRIDKKKEVFSFLQFYGYLKKFNYSKREIIFFLVKYSKFSTLGIRGLIKSSKIILKEIFA